MCERFILGHYCEHVEENRGRVFLLCVRKESENICERYKINLKEQDAQGKKSKQEKRL